MAAEDYKTCTECGQPRLLKYFYKHRRTKDGYTYECSDCIKANVHAWQKANPKRANEGRRRWQKQNRELLSERARQEREENPDSALERNRRHRERHPAKDRARNLLNTAVTRGKIEKPDCCEECGEIWESWEIHAHHKDYERPLDVEWLCIECHHRRHEEDNEALSASR
jgi:hypothetical protein